MRRPLLFILLLVSLNVAQGQTGGTCDYWFDSNYAARQTISLRGGFCNMEIDVSGLTDAVHTIHFQTTAGEGVHSPVTSHLFVKYPPVVASPTHQPDGNGYYWFDSDYANRKSISLKDGSCVSQIDVSGLTDGVHTIHFQATAGEGAQSPVASHLFVKYPPVEASPTYTSDGNCCYWFDSDYADRKQIALSGGLATLDVGHLSAGVHTIHFQGSGTAYTPTASKLFVIMPDKEDANDKITRYDYWVNDAGTPTSVVLPEPVSALSLVSLLPVETQPFRSSCFHFTLEDEQPVLYAKNDIRLRFYLSETNFSDITAQYVDYGVKQDVTDIKLLEAGIRQTEAKPAKNVIIWYKLVAEAGDNLQFKLDRAATVQLFSPSGKEVYAASGETSVKWGGIDAEETGTYYVALHDVTAKSGSTISIDYEHTDRYAVLRQDITAIGNGGPSTITFQGNGFDELASVDLMLGETTIVSTELKADGKATVSVKWNFTDAPLGQYKGVFHFADDDVTIDDCITVEEAKPFSFEETVSFASQYLRSNNNTYTFKIRNNSNMTAYEVPLAIHIYSPNAESLKRVKIGGYDVKEHFVSLVGDEGKERAEAIVKQNEGVSGERFYFLEDDETEYVEGHPYLHHAFISPDLRPNATQTITVSIQSTEEAYVYMWYPLEWEDDNNLSRPSDRRRTSSGGCAIAKRTSLLCEENRRLVENGFDPIYKVDCDNLPYPDNCPPPPGGPSTPVASRDPNDIYGYQDADGDKTIRNGLVDVWYTIEFENDPEFATASAHDIYISDQLNPQLFDLSSFAPTRVQIGNKEAELTGGTSGVVTINMQPEIYAIAIVEWSIDEQTGMANWHISSLDPMTMEPTDDVLQGVLPVNNDGNGIGQLSFDVSLKPNLPNGTRVDNMATIVFDANEPIETPTWTNVIENILMGDVNDDGKVDYGDIVAVMAYMTGKSVGITLNKADVNGDGVVGVGDIITITKNMSATASASRKATR